MKSMEKEFFAWLDGELSGAEAAAIEERVRADPDLQRLADRHRAMGERIHCAFDRVAMAPLPKPINKAARTPPPVEVVDLANFRQNRNARFKSPNHWFAVAASLALGFVTATMLHPPSEPIRIERGQLFAAASLGQALDRELASNQRNSLVRIGVTFHNHAGEFCRSFSEERISGFACRDRNRWQLRGLVGQTEAAVGDYRMAASSDPEIASMITTAMVGAPLDANEERAARDNGWR